MPKIGIFLDVDDTLTDAPIQSYFADAVGVSDEYNVLEEKYKAGEIDSDSFARKIISIYQNNNFTKSKCEEYSKNVRLRPWAERLIELNSEDDIDIYLVSSGPSFYINRLRDRFNIDAERTLASRYEFDDDGKLSGNYDPVSPPRKASFVEAHASKYDFTIGVGDNGYLDGPFLAYCTIKILMERDQNYLYAPSLEIAYDIVEKITAISSDVGNFKFDDISAADLVNAIPRLTLSSYAVILPFLGLVYAAGKFLS